MCGELPNVQTAAVETPDAELKCGGSSSSAHPLATASFNNSQTMWLTQVNRGLHDGTMSFGGTFGGGSTENERMVNRSGGPRQRAPANLPPLEAGSGYPMIRSKTWPQFDPFSPKFIIADPNRRDLQIQTLVDTVQIGDLYDLGAVIGSGGFGKVQDSLNAYTFQPYALKVMPKARLAVKEGSSQDLTEENFRETIEFLMNQRQRFTVTITRTFEDAKFYYVVMEKCTGGDLRAHINRLHDQGRQLEEDKLQEIVCMVGEALGYLHSNFRLHRDVKPENVLFCTEERDLVKLADFDMCCIYPEGEEFVLSSRVVGTPGYLAPEVLEHKRYSRQSDLFALGALMHFCATGEVPTETLSASEVITWCEMTELKLVEGSVVGGGHSPELRQAMGSLLKADPASRADRVETFMECEWLERYVGGGVLTPKIKRKKKPNSLKPLKRSTVEESIQRLLTINFEMESPHVASAA